MRCALSTESAYLLEQENEWCYSDLPSEMKFYSKKSEPKNSFKSDQKAPGHNMQTMRGHHQQND